MGEYLSFVSIDTWTLIFSWINLLILFLLLKHFLFKPIRKILKQREDEIEASYTDAEHARTEADALKFEYDTRLKSADAEVKDIITDAVDKANRRGEEIVTNAQDEARQITERARKRIELEKAEAVDKARGEIAGMAADIAGKVLEQKMDDETDKRMIESIIDKL